MTAIGSFIFMDLETTGFPWQQNNMTNIVEIAMVAAGRDHIINDFGFVPRVLQKLVLCFSPKIAINWRATNITGLDNDILQRQRNFDLNSLEILARFIACQIQPVCFVVHNGYGFDYPILRAAIDDLGHKLPDDVMCIDSLPMFRTLMKCPEFIEPPININVSCNTSVEIANVSAVSEPDDEFGTFLTESDLLLIEQIENSLTKDLPTSTNANNGFVNNTSAKPKRTSYKLKDIYKRLYSKEATDLHRAENDCMILLECCLAKSIDFVEWSENNCIKFNNIQRMRVGEKFPSRVIAVLSVALLWGGTNPLIKIASKNISSDKKGKFYKDFFQLITNWKYIIPFLLNQCGSVVYVGALQNAELSLVVPITNSLTFLFTALSGWVVGEEHPNIGTLFGMIFILLGTTMCWYDKTYQPEDIYIKT